MSDGLDEREKGPPHPPHPPRPPHPPHGALVPGSSGVRSIDAARYAGQRVFEVELGLDRHVGLWETRAMPSLFESGRQAARAQLAQWAQIKALLRQAGRQQQEQQPQPPRASAFGPIAA